MQTSQHFFHIAIDGPVAAGKGTVSRLVAERLGFLYVDTGAMYRMTALLAKGQNVPYEDEAKLVELVEASSMDLRVPQDNSAEQDGRLITALLDGTDVSWDIRTEEISQGASIVSKHPEVRRVLVERQKEIAQGKSVVMEGRDITYRVLPEANLKIFLDASAEERAQRRYQQLKERNPEITEVRVLEEIKERDARDMNRDADPLQVVEGAWVLDTTNLSIDEVADAIVQRVRSTSHDTTTN